jgi:hypothetical protein
VAGFISNPNVAPPDDAWSLWRDAVTLANVGENKRATRLLQDVLDHPQLPPDLRKIAEDRQRQGWTRPHPTRGLDRNGPIPF